MSAHPRTAGPPLAVGVILVEDGAGRGAGALPLLLARAAADAAADADVVLVDPRRPPGWQSELADRLLQIGCGASADFDAGVAAGAAALVGRGGTRLLVAAGAALATAAGRPVAELLDDYALITAERSGAALFAPVPASEESDGGGASGLWLLPSAAAAAVAERAEHGLARRLAAAGVPVAGLAVVRRLRDRGVEAGAIAGASLARLPAGAAELEDGPERVPSAFAFDRVELPDRLEHGARATVRLLGWMVGPDDRKGVALWVGGRRVLAGGTTIRRPDVVAAFPQIEREDCGFELAGEIGPLAPGRYSVVWRGEARGCSKRFGRLRVAPVHRLEVTRVFLPRVVPRGASAPVELSGRLVTSAAAAKVEARAGGRPLEVSTVHFPSPDPDLPGRFEFSVHGRIEPVRLGRTTRRRLEVRSSDAVGAQVWETRVSFRAGGVAVASALDEPWVGGFDPRSGSTPVELRGIVCGAGPGDRVELLVDSAPAGSTPVAGDACRAAGDARFALEAAVVALTPGSHRLELLLARADGPRQTIRRWTQQVAERPVSAREVTATVAAPHSSGGESRLVVEGGLEPGDAVDSLALEVDGRVRARLGAEWFDDAGGDATGRLRRFRLDTWVALEAGRRSLAVRARRGASEVEVWRGEIEAPPASDAAAARIHGADLDRLVRDSPILVWSRLAVTGEVAGGRPGDTIELELAPGPSATARVGVGGRFAVVARPRGDGIHRGRLRLRRAGEVVARSPAFQVRSRPLQAPARTVGALEDLLAALAPGRARFAGFGADAVLTELFASAPEAIGDLRRALGALDARRRAAARDPGEVVLDPAEPEDGGRDRLRVLFGAWEPPCSLHGGGVAIRNLLLGLGGRHDITVVHTCAPGEEGLSEEIRPVVRELLSVRREWHPEPPPLAFDVPLHAARSFSPRYREALEAELATGAYDLFNGDFLRTALHVDVSDRPSVGVSHEFESFAQLATAPDSFSSVEEAAVWLSVLLRALHFETVFAPGRVREFATVSEPEARFLSGLIPGRRIFVNPVPVDTERLATIAARRAPAEPPTFLFVGNFVHPPNRDAGHILAGRIAPEVIRSRPDATFVLAGANPPEELRALDGRNGVRVTGFVPDLGDLLAGATAFVAPIFSGAGMRVKVLEALAAGCPVVSTPLGLSGIGGRPGETWLQADTVDGLVAVLRELAAQPERVGRLGEEGRRWVEREFGIAAQASRRERIWRAALAAGDARAEP